MAQSNPQDDRQLALFEAQSEKQLPESIALMHKLYGKRENADCQFCIHFLRHRSPRYTQCARFTALGGHENKWHATWPACGQFTDARE